MTARYQTIADTLRTEILTGVRRPADKLPTEAQLVASHGASRGTVRRALAVLSTEGLISTTQGSGSYVTSVSPLSRFFSLSSFDADTRAAGMEPSTKVLYADVTTADDDVAERLNTSVGTRVIVVRRLRLADGVPAAVEERVLCETLCPGLLGEDLEHQSLHWLLAVRYAIPLVRIEHVVERRPAIGQECRDLGIAPREPIMAIDRLTYTDTPAGNQPAVWFRATHRTAYERSSR